MFTATLSVRSLLFVLGLVGLVLLGAVDSRATEYRVDITEDILTFPPDPRISLRSALIRANSNPGTDEIILPAGTYTLKIAGIDPPESASHGDLDIFDSVTITGAGPDKTIIDGKDLNDRIFHLPYDGYGPRINVLISNLTIQNGKLTATDANVGGGGIHNRQTLTLNNVVVRNNSVAGAGGGGIQSDHELTLKNVVVRGNRVDEVGDTDRRNGGGILNNGSMVMTDSIVAGNRGRSGAGIFTHDALIERSLFTGNWAGLAGGAILSVGALQLVNATIHANTSGSNSQALRVTFGEAQLSFCTITGNQSFLAGFASSSRYPVTPCF